MWPPRSRTSCRSLPPEGAAAPVARQSRFHGPCLKGRFALPLTPSYSLSLRERAGVRALRLGSMAPTVAHCVSLPAPRGGRCACGPAKPVPRPLLEGEIRSPSYSLSLRERAGVRGSRPCSFLFRGKVGMGVLEAAPDVRLRTDDLIQASFQASRQPSPPPRPSLSRSRRRSQYRFARAAPAWRVRARPQSAPRRSRVRPGRHAASP